MCVSFGRMRRDVYVNDIVHAFFPHLRATSNIEWIKKKEKPNANKIEDNQKSRERVRKKTFFCIHKMTKESEKYTCEQQTQMVNAWKIFDSSRKVFIPKRSEELRLHLCIPNKWSMLWRSFLVCTTKVNLSHWRANVNGVRRTHTISLASKMCARVSIAATFFTIALFSHSHTHFQSS